MIRRDPEEFAPAGGFAGDVARLALGLLAVPYLLARELPVLWRAWKARRELPKSYTVIHTKRRPR